jgi:hypothetical protein
LNFSRYGETSLHSRCTQSITFQNQINVQLQTKNVVHYEVIATMLFNNFSYIAIDTLAQTTHACVYCRRRRRLHVCQIFFSLPCLFFNFFFATSVSVSLSRTAKIHGGVALPKILYSRNDAKNVARLHFSDKLLH